MSQVRQYDVVILGSGPAGLQAAVHAARKKVSVCVLGRTHRSSLFWAHVENFCCIFKITGEEMLAVGREQARNFGAEFLEEDVLSIAPEAGGYLVRTESSDTIETSAVILAMGTSRNKLGVPGEKELLGRGVSYCVECDAGFFKKEKVVVVGGASAAVGGALTISNYASEVHLVCGELEVADSLVEELGKTSVVVHEGAKVQEIAGSDKVEAVVLESGDRIECAGVFIELGAKGVMELALGLGVQLDDEMKYVVTDKKQRTNMEGVYAAGDICGPPLQMAKAVGEGCVAGLEAAVLAKKAKRQKESDSS